jgi:DNA-directed RNA polymerase sigma subunit (sigma70/sigma32)
LHYQKELEDYKYEDLAYDEKEFEKVLDNESIIKFVHNVLDKCIELYPYKKICFDIVKLHHGISTKYPMTKKEIAIQLNISVDRVRDYYKEGIKTIRDFILKHQSLAKDAMILLSNV